MIGRTPKELQMSIFEDALESFIFMNHKRILLSNQIDWDAVKSDFAFSLTGNRISSLTNAGTHGSGVTYTSYTYDANGNTTHDGRTGQDLAWNEQNLISGVSTTSGTSAENNANEIRTDNLIRRILKLPQRDGSDHGGYKEGHITNPNDLPILK